MMKQIYTVAHPIPVRKVCVNTLTQIDKTRRGVMPDTDRYQTYRNNDENAKTVGWALIPEFCVGCPEAAFVTHDTRLGYFFFHENPSMFEGSSLIHDDAARMPKGPNKI